MSTPNARTGSARARPRLGNIASVMRAFAPYMVGRRRKMAAAIGASIGVMAMKLAEPWPLKIIVDVYFFNLPAPAWLSGLGLGAGGFGLLWVMVLLVVLIGAAGGGFFFVQRLNTSAAAIEATSALRLDIYAALQRMPIRYHEAQPLGDTLLKLTNDVTALRDSFISIPIRIIEQMLLIIGVVIVMLLLNGPLTLLALAALPLLGWTINRFAKRIRRALAQQRAREGRVSNQAAAAMAGVKVIQVLQGEAREQARLKAADSRGTAAAMEAAMGSAKLQLLGAVMSGAAVAAVIGMAAVMVTRGQLTPGDVVVFAAYLKTLYEPVRGLAALVQRTGRATVSGERVLGLLRSAPDIADAPDAQKLRRVRKGIRLRDVHLALGPPGAGLNGISLSVPAGQRVVLVGRSGAGKSTLTSLVPRLYDPDQGRVEIDGKDLRSLQLASLRDQIAVVHQVPMLFSLSVGENIAYGRANAAPEDAPEAARAAGVAEVFEALPKGYETRIGEGGATLSGGQRQCVAIARAMMRDAPILILDEPTTGLDPDLSALVIAALSRLSAGRTVLLVTHDPRLLQAGDRVVRLEAGKIISDSIYDPDNPLPEFDLY